MPRSTKHARIPPTREVFWPATNGTAVDVKGVHTGYIVDDDTDLAYIEGMVPHDYHGVVECALVFIAGISLATMTINVDADYAQAGELCTLQSQGAFEFSKTRVGLNKIDEIDIRNVINGDATVRAIMRGDYIGFRPQRVAGQNTNALILGIRFRYKVFRTK